MMCGLRASEPATTMAMNMEIGAQSDVGYVRENNEDSFGLAPEMNLFVLSDGMGGLASGEVASRLAVETIIEYCREADANPSQPAAGERIDGVSEISNRLASAVRLANQIVHEAAGQNLAGQSMGATVVAVRFTDERMSVAHVGDSRVYRLRGDAIEQLTQDHSFVAEEIRRGRMTAEEASGSNLQNVLVRALGIEPEVEVDVTEELVQDGDTVLLCSDGLTRELSDPQIAAVLGERNNAQKAASRLIELAKLAGGGDNVTAIVIRRAPTAGGEFARISRIGKWFKDSRSN